MLLPERRITRLGAFSALLLPGCNSIWDLSVAWGIPQVIPQPVGFYNNPFLFLQQRQTMLSPDHIFEAAGNSHVPSCPLWDSQNGLVLLRAASAKPIWLP